MENEFGDFYPKDWIPPERQKFCPLHTHHELKYDLRKKCRLVSGGNMLDASGHNNSSSMVNNSSVKLSLLIATANNLKVEGGNVQIAHLNAKCREKSWTITGLEFGDKVGMKTLIKKASCGLKTSGRKFLELLADMLSKMGFTPTRHDKNVWIKPRKGGCD